MLRCKESLNQFDLMHIFEHLTIQEISLQSSFLYLSSVPSFLLMEHKQLLKVFLFDDDCVLTKLTPLIGVCIVVVFLPLEFTVILPALLPTDIPTEFLLKFRFTPFPNLIVFLNRIDILSHPFLEFLSVFNDPSNDSNRLFNDVLVGKVHWCICRIERLKNNSIILFQQLLYTSTVTIHLCNHNIT